MSILYGVQHELVAPYHYGMTPYRRLCLIFLYLSLWLLIPMSGCCCLGFSGHDLTDPQQAMSMASQGDRMSIASIGISGMGAMAFVLLLSGVVLLHKEQLREAAVTRSARKTGWVLVVAWAASSVLLSVGVAWRLHMLEGTPAVEPSWSATWWAILMVLWTALIVACSAVLARRPPPTPWDEPL